MKKHILKLLPCMILLLASCSGVDYKAINEKIDREGFEAEFSQQEYQDMIKFLENNMEKVFKHGAKALENLNNLGTEDYSPSYNDNELADLGVRVNHYLMILDFAQDEGRLDSSNSEKFDKIYQKSVELSKKYFDIDF